MRKWRFFVQFILIQVVIAMLVSENTLAIKDGNKEDRARHQAGIAQIYSFYLHDDYHAQIEYNKLKSLYPEYAYFGEGKIEKINNSQIGTIQGDVVLGDERQRDKVDIIIFDGFAKILTSTDGEGFFNIPIFRVTPGCYIYIFMSREGYFPAVKRIQVKGKQSYSMGTVEQCTYKIGEVVLRKLTSSDGVIIGIWYGVIRGGKMTPHYGIDGVRQTEITVEGQSGIYTISSNSEGIFSLSVPEGEYKLKDKITNLITGPFKVKQGQTTIQNIGGRHKLVD